MQRIYSEATFDALLFGGALALLGFDIYFLAKGIFLGNFIPVVPVVAGILTACGLVFILGADQLERGQSRREHYRLSRVAHQLEGPLTALQTDLAALLLQADKLPADGRLKLKRMETKTNVLLSNIRDVFLTLQSQGGKLAQETRVYDICALVEEAIKRAAPQAAARNVEIIHKKYCPEAAVKVDRRLFLIALQHLLDNAVTYTLTPGLVNVVLIKGKRWIRAIVQDRGLGIKHEDRPSVFSPFARGSHAEQYDPDGIGLGLTLARAIIREFGGELVYRPREKSAGSEFEIRLPLAEA